MTTDSSTRADRRAALLRVLLGRSGPVVPTADTWAKWTALAQFEHVVPSLFHLVDCVPTDLRDEQRESVMQLEIAAMSRCVRLEHHLLQVARDLDAAAIRFAVLKGSATAYLDYPDPSWREFNDIDLLVAPADLVRTVAVLESTGWARGYSLPSGHLAYAHAITLRRSGVELDVHQRIARRALGVLVPTDRLLERASPFEVDGVAMLALDEIDRMIHAAVHAVAARYPSRLLTTLTDLLVAAELRPHLAPEVLGRAEDRQVRAIVEHGVRDAYAAAQLDLHPVWAAAMRRPSIRRDRLIDLAYATPNRRPIVEELAYLRLLDGWGSRWRYVRGYFATGDQASAHDQRSVRARARYLIAKVRSGSKVKVRSKRDGPRR